VTVATAKKLIEQGVISRNGSTVLAITGNGLKTQEAIQDVVGEPAQIEPNLASFETRVMSNPGTPVKV
jgi:threonine synthase